MMLCSLNLRSGEITGQRRERRRFPVGDSRIDLPLLLVAEAEQGVDVGEVRVDGDRLLE
jgi:hypothetical protein